VRQCVRGTPGPMPPPSRWPPSMAKRCGKALLQRLRIRAGSMPAAQARRRHRWCWPGSTPMAASAPRRPMPTRRAMRCCLRLTASRRPTRTMSWSRGNGWNGRVPPACSRTTQILAAVGLAQPAGKRRLRRHAGRPYRGEMDRTHPHAADSGIHFDPCDFGHGDWPAFPSPIPRWSPRPSQAAQCRPRLVSRSDQRNVRADRGLGAGRRAAIAKPGPEWWRDNWASRSPTRAKKWIARSACTCRSAQLVAAWRKATASGIAHAALRARRCRRDHAVEQSRGPPLAKIASALVFGNSVVWKPALPAPEVARAIVASLAAAGIPPGLLSTVFGDAGTAQALIAHPAVAAVTLTGSQRPAGRLAALRTPGHHRFKPNWAATMPPSSWPTPISTRRHARWRIGLRLRRTALHGHAARHR
jgi:hypothetical protein